MIKIENKAKIDRVVLLETAYIAGWTFIFSAVMQIVFMLLGKWDYTVILGNLLGGAAVVLNFLLMGITVQKAVAKDEKDAKQTMQVSQSARLLMMFAVALLGFLLPCFNPWATIIPFFFTRIAIALRPLFGKKSKR